MRSRPYACALREGVARIAKIAIPPRLHLHIGLSYRSCELARAAKGVLHVDVLEARALHQGTWQYQGALNVALAWRAAISHLPDHLAGRMRQATIKPAKPEQPHAHQYLQQKPFSASSKVQAPPARVKLALQLSQIFLSVANDVPACPAPALLVTHGCHQATSKRHVRLCDTRRGA